MKINRGDADAAIALLAELHPRCFSIYEGRRRPLKVGIRADVVARVNGAIEPHELSLALAMYCRNAGYLRSLRVGAVRIDLDGNAAGVVTAEEAAWAAEELGTRMLRTANRRRSPQKQPAQETTVVPRRLGLADLKRLALSRRK